MSEIHRISLWENSRIWFGAAVSVAEILTGTLLAPLGLARAAAAIIIGHLIGGFLLYGAGLIGPRYRCSAMEGVKQTFGGNGGRFFAVINVLQLAGWTTVMLLTAAGTVQNLFPLPGNGRCWVLITALLIAGQFGVGNRIMHFFHLTLTAVLLLLIAVTSVQILRLGMTAAPAAAGTLSFGEALELSIAMPVSWLPLIADYTCGAAKPKISALVCSGVYTLISGWMYFIGAAAAIYSGKTDLAGILSLGGQEIAAAAVIILATVTTTYLDVYSGGLSAGSVCNKISFRTGAAAVAVIGTAAALSGIPDFLENFLYWIGSCFVPMAAIQLLDTFAGGQKAAACHTVLNLGIWTIGFLSYRLFLKLELQCGSTLPALVITAAVYLLVHAVSARIIRKPVR